MVRVKRQLLRLGVTVVTRILLISPPHVAASLLTVPVLAGLSKLAVSNPYIYLHMYKTSLLCRTKVRITYGVTALLAKIRYGIFHMIMDKAVLSQTTSDSPT